LNNQNSELNQPKVNDIEILRATAAFHQSSINDLQARVIAL
jgi:hypothetical protein